MQIRKALCIALLAAMLPASFASVFGQKPAKRTAAARAVMWSPVNVARRDLYYGPGGTAMRPVLNRVSFIKREKGGNNLKYRIRDGRGREWVAKIADESQPEVVATRLLWAVGYQTEIDYLVPQLYIPGKKTYRNVRLEARPANIKRGDRWVWKQNPFIGTRELQGLKVMMALINNWDLKDDNNAILNAGGQRRYVVSDMGSSFGKLPVASMTVLNRIGRSVNDPEDYVNSTFIHGLENDGTVDFVYKGKAKELLKGITVAEARWIGGQLNKLSDKQIRDAFRAANYSRPEIDLMARAVRGRINMLNGMTVSSDEVVGRQ